MGGTYSGNAKSWIPRYRWEDDSARPTSSSK
jgi:hypothetical protein